MWKNRLPTLNSNTRLADVGNTSLETSQEIFYGKKEKLSKDGLPTTPSPNELQMPRVYLRSNLNRPSVRKSLFPQGAAAGHTDSVDNGDYTESQCGRSLSPIPGRTIAAAQTDFSINSSCQEVSIDKAKLNKQNSQGDGKRANILFGFQSTSEEQRQEANTQIETASSSGGFTSSVNVSSQKHLPSSVTSAFVAAVYCEPFIDSLSRDNSSIIEEENLTPAIAIVKPATSQSQIRKKPAPVLIDQVPTEGISKQLNDISILSPMKHVDKSAAEIHRECNVDDRSDFFTQLKSISALLARKREHQEQNTAGASCSSRRSEDTTDGILTDDPEFYYAELTDEEEKLIHEFLFEANEVKTRMGLKYGIDTVQGSWGMLLKGPHLKEFRRDLYNALMDESLLIPTQISQQLLEDRAQAFIRIISTTVNMFNKPREMVDFLVQTGADHQRFGIGENEFFVLRNAVLRLLPNYLPAEVVEASAKDWGRFWGLTINLMTQGGNTPEGKNNRKLYEGDYAKQVQTIIRDIKTKQATLELEKQFVNVMFDKSREICPHLEKFRALFNNRRNCDRFFNSVVMIADHISNPESNEEYMEEIGGRHVAYGVTREILEECEKPFILALQEFVAEGVWNITIEHNFELLYRSMVEGVSAGMNNGKDTTANRWAPDGSEPFCLLFTDVESSTNLWQRYPTVMREAIDKHHRIIRTVIADFGGYEVKTAGDSFIIAVKDVLAGLKIAVAIQLELMRQVPIAEGFEMLDDVQGHGDPEAWNKQTLRVRIGIQHCTEATATYDSIHRRYDYYGTSVNQCARIEAAAAGGQILMSRETFKALKAIPAFHDEPCPAFLRDIEGNSPIDARGFDHFVAMCDVGKVKLKGIKRPVHLASVVPMCLAGRDFKDVMVKNGLDGILF